MSEGDSPAVGARAAWLTADRPLDYGFGPGSPLEKPCQAGGKVLLLGTPFESLLSQLGNRFVPLLEPGFG
jgi:hypothetical protein